jgi:hypothetical protein
MNQISEAMMGVSVRIFQESGILDMIDDSARCGDPGEYHGLRICVGNHASTNRHGTR